MSTEINVRIGRLLAEAETRRQAAALPRDGLRRRLGRALVSAGLAIEGRAATAMEASEPRVPCPPAAEAKA